MNRFEKQVVAFTSVTHGLVHVLELAYGALLASIALEFGASLFVLGMLANIMGFFFGATSVPAGLISDRRKEKALLVVCCLGMGAAAIAIGLANSIPVLGAGLLAMGMALGIYHPAGAALISRAVSKRGRGFGYQGVGGNIGLAIGPVTAGAIGAVLGWRAAYLIFAVPPLALGLLILLVMRSEPPSADPTVSVSVEKPSLRPILLPVVLIFASTIFNGFVYRALVTFLPVYLSERVQLASLSNVMVAGSLTSLAFMFGVVGQFAGGHLAERISRERLVFSLYLVSVPLLVLVGSTAGMLLVAVAAAFAFIHFFTQPVNNVLVTDYIPSLWRGRIFGLYFFCNFGVGSFSAGALGYLASEVGLRWVFIASAGFSLLALACIVVLWVKSAQIKRKVFAGD